MRTQKCDFLKTKQVRAMVFIDDLYIESPTCVFQGTHYGTPKI